jgi:hypothetical protein
MRHNIHPAIRKFWEAAGYDVLYFETRYITERNETAWYARPEDGREGLQIALMADEWDSPVYMTDSDCEQVYSEADMLRLIKLKAFW